MTLTSMAADATPCTTRCSKPLSIAYSKRVRGEDQRERAELGAQARDVGAGRAEDGKR